jgi:hypothetical protein
MRERSLCISSSSRARSIQHKVINSTNRTKVGSCWQPRITCHVLSRYTVKFAEAKGPHVPIAGSL